MRVDDLDYDLPAGLVAQEPARRREDARLLVLDRAAGTRQHATVERLPELLGPGDLLVLNDTRVLPARVHARRTTGGAVEVLLIEGRADGTWEALLRAGGRPAPGEVLAVDAALGLELVEALGGGRWRVRGAGAGVETIMAAHGRMPLPPYIRRVPGDGHEASDRERYQTVYARVPGAVAAPTAGLHLTASLLAALAARGVASAPLTLHVGTGTFAPVRVEHLEDHAMHEEAYEVPAATVEAVRATRAAGGRVVAVGTTSVRALEAAAADGGLRPGAGRTDLLIRPGHEFRVVDAMLTNFHLPRSTLLALVAAFAGLEAMREAYAEAIARRYRFYSYGDAMLIV